MLRNVYSKNALKDAGLDFLFFIISSILLKCDILTLKDTFAKINIIIQNRPANLLLFDK